MKKTLFYLLLTLFCLQACRTEDGNHEISTSEAISQQKILDKDLKLTVYKSYRNYLSNKGINKFGNDIDFGLSSQILKYKNGERGLVFPLVKDHNVKGLVLATLSKDEKFVKFNQLNPVENEAIKKAFEIKYDKIKFLVPENSNISDTKNNSSSGYLYSRDLRCFSEPSMEASEANGRDCNLEAITINGRARTLPISPVEGIQIPVYRGNQSVVGDSRPLSPEEIRMLTARDPITNL
ncbi:hypothetical protein GNY06_00225, partial [Elizabethkingia argentiflava]|nr:hypothetical protein [Elizabethkingia argenteiflava]